MNTWVIAVIVVIVLIVLLVCCLGYIKKRIQNKLIDKGADMITKATGEYLDEETAGKVNNVTNATAKILKGSKMDLVKAAAKKGLELAKNNKKERG